MNSIFKNCIFLFTLLTSLENSFSQTEWKHGRLKVTENGHYLQYEDGTPFFWLGDTGWELFHRLKKEEIEKYLENRKQKGFNVIQSVILAEFSGLTKPNQYGDLPLQGLDPTKPDEKYFQLVDWVIKTAWEKGMFIGLLPTWGDKVIHLWGNGPIIFNEANAYSYGLFLGKRYRDFPNIIWITGGDRPAFNDTIDLRPVWRAMIKGIREGTDQKAIITYHPWGESSSAQFWKDENVLDVNMMQSGHARHDIEVWDWIRRDRDVVPAKPVLDGEPNYEDHPVKWDSKNGYFRDYDVRKQIYRSVFSGACGVTYGHHAVWQFYSDREEKVAYADRYWTAAIDRPGAFQAGYLRRLMESRPSLDRIPDQSIIAVGQGEKGEYMTAFRNADSSYAMIYLPVGKRIQVNSSSLKSNQLKAWWFNPRSGKTSKIGLMKKKNLMPFTPPSTGIENDWVLVLEDPAKKWIEP